ncbi:uncharacterized protein LOC129777686 isoform X2 [Toxorhynchites rutilus septentrionalis]|nr:uncharacterized protein LOC129777686 isoform X2 [Toxorhynchites rutilus septentrionalis]
MNLKIFLNIQWLFFILFYGCSSGCYKSVEAVAAKVAHSQQMQQQQKHYRQWLRYENEPAKRQKRSIYSAESTQLVSRGNNRKDFEEHKETHPMQEEHDHYEISPILTLNRSDSLTTAGDDMEAAISITSKEEARKALLRNGPRILGIGPSVGQKVQGEGAFVDANKDQNNDDADDAMERTDYKYKIANLAPSKRGAPAEIDDMEVVRGRKSSLSSAGTDKWRQEKDNNTMSEQKEQKKKQEKSSPLVGRLKRKLLSIVGESLAATDDRDGAGVDYDDDKRGGMGNVPTSGHSYRNEDSADPGKAGVREGDYYSQINDSGGSYGDVSEPDSSLGDASIEHATAPRDTRNWHKVNKERRNVKEMDRHVDNLNKATFHGRKSVNPVGVIDVASPDNLINERGTTEREMAQLQRTIYHQHYDDLGDSKYVESDTCDCALKCAREREQAMKTMEPPDADEEFTTAVVEEENFATEEPIDNLEATAKAVPEAEQQKEVYIDLKIAIKNTGNGSSSELEPVEFHKKIIVKRDGRSDNTGGLPTSSQQKSTQAQFPADLVKAIYQLVDKNDSLRKHLGPGLPDPAKLLFKLEQNRASREKINDRRRSLISGDGDIPEVVYRMK